MIIRRKGQTVLEYVTLMIIVLGAFVAVGSYFKRGIQGRWKASVDGLGDQYDPDHMTTDITYSVTSSINTLITTVNAVNGFVTMRDDKSAQTENKSGFMRVDAP